MQKIINIQCGNKRDIEGATLTQGLVFSRLQDMAGDEIVKAFVNLPQETSSGFEAGVYIAITIPPERVINTSSILWQSCGYSTACRPSKYWSEEDLEIYLENKSVIDSLKIIENKKNTCKLES